ncbi:hypothetical protein A2U01_0108829, partial [Trifolium medium]|nr:hypothetical protein [Trifolium medium]
ITGEDIAQVSPQKERKDLSESDEELPASEAIVTAVITPKRKRAVKEKNEVVVEEKKKKSDKSSASGVGASE